MDPNDAQYGANILGGLRPQYFCSANLGEFSNCMEVVLRKPLGNIRVPTLVPCQFDDRDDGIRVPVNYTSFSIISD
jgi:hypothetical protein